MLHPIYRRFFVTFLVLLSFLAMAFAQEKPRADWSAFSKQLVRSVTSPNAGVRASAMQQIIRYHDSLDVYAARFDLMDIFLESNDPGVRRLALIALHKINSRFDLGYLQLHYPYEKDTKIKRQIAAVLLDAGYQIANR